MIGTLSNLEISSLRARAAMSTAEAAALAEAPPGAGKSLAYLIPLADKAMIISAAPEKTCPSAETMTTSIVSMLIGYCSFVAFSTASSIEPTM
jgi:hypothetical protein